MPYLDKMAWQMLKGAETVEYQFWGEVPMDIQEQYIINAKKVIVTIENRLLNGNWTEAIQLFIDTPGIKLSYLKVSEDTISLGDYVIEELEKEYQSRIKRGDLYQCHF